MSFRHDMQGKTSQQQAIVRQRDEADKRTKEASEKKKRETFTNEVSYEKSPRLADYEGIYLKDKDKYLVELRVSGTAMVNGPCGLTDEDIHQWLYQIGKQFVYDIKKYEIITIRSTDVLNKKLITNWKNLKRSEDKQI